MWCLIGPQHGVVVFGDAASNVPKAVLAVILYDTISSLHNVPH